MNTNQTLNKYNLKCKIIKDIFTFLSQSVYFKNINFKRFKNVSSYEKSKCLIISKNLSNYLRENKINKINNSTLLSIIINNANKNNLKIYKKNIELIKFYTILFTEKSCSHLTFYLFNNLNNSINEENKECLSIIIDKTPKRTIILNEYLDIITKKYSKETKGEIFLYREENNIFKNIKHKVSLCFFSIIIGYLLIYKIPSNYIVMEMNLTMHMKMNHNGNIISYKPKTKSAKNMIKETKQLNRKMNDTIPYFINYGLENNILKPGEKVKIYIMGPPLNNRFFESLKNSLQGIPLNIIINNSGNLIKINRT